MKKSIILLFACIVAAVAVAQQLAKVSSALASVHTAPAFSWSETTFDFGKTKAGEPVTHKFTFTNAGSEALLITSVVPSCGCTVADYSKDPIPANGSGYIKATYNAAKPGVFSKTVTVHANTSDATVLLTIKGEVTE